MTQPNLLHTPSPDRPVWELAPGSVEDSVAESARSDSSSPLIALSQAAALDAALVGAKAAGLAAALQAGLPVLPGVVVPEEVGRAAIADGALAVQARGMPAGRLAVFAGEFDAGLASALESAATELGNRLLVRSSSALDGDAAWCGAFGSVGDVAPSEVSLAVQSVWSSVFSPDALRRFAATGLQPAAAEIAVLIQRQLDPVCGGSATVEADGSVSIWAAAGAPAPLLAGMATGVRLSVERDEAVPEDLGGLPIDSATLRALAAACRRAYDELGFDQFEWAAEDEQAWLLQLDRESGSNTAVEDHAIADGVVFRGLPASPGQAVGRTVFVSLDDLDHPPSVAGAILVVDDPLPVFAPLLWEAAGLVALRGNPAAHLFSVARSLHVPAVVGLLPFNQDALGSLGIGGATVVVDGDGGMVAVTDQGVSIGGHQG